jgi:hypothetical protein
VVRGPTRSNYSTIVYRGVELSQVERAKPKVEPADDHLIPIRKTKTFNKVTLIRPKPVIDI